MVGSGERGIILHPLFPIKLVPFERERERAQCVSEAGHPPLNGVLQFFVFLLFFPFFYLFFYYYYPLLSISYFCIAKQFKEKIIRLNTMENDTIKYDGNTYIDCWSVHKKVSRFNKIFLKFKVYNVR